MSTQVISYAPGDGAIAFTCVDKQFNRNSGDFEQIANERNPSREEVEAIQQSNFPDYLLIQLDETSIRQKTIQVEVPTKRRRKNPKMETQTITVEIPPQFRLCAPVFRVGPSTLRIGDTIYKYYVNEDNIFWSRDRKYTDHNISIRCLWHIEENEKVTDDTDEVRNINTRGSICWFLNHEKTIVHQYPDQDETTAATVDHRD